MLLELKVDEIKVCKMEIGQPLPPKKKKNIVCYDNNVLKCIYISIIINYYYILKYIIFQ